MWGTIAILVFAVGLHYALEYMSNPDNSNYSCPSYCEVEHEHIISKNKTSVIPNIRSNLKKSDFFTCSIK